jgi:hypothetical protein
MGWLDALERRAREAVGSVPAAAPVRVPAEPQAAPDIKTVWVQTAQPRNGDAGAAEPGFYSVTDDVLTMHDENGKPTGRRYALGATEDPRQVAARMTRDSWLANTPDFNRPINYQPLGIA